ncbi:G-type lectin S-receptor-like serine/threonine-protein kinase At5g35370 [Andrographis paniculata]|uniref:G-type lectin S-receptor-like serine/threonine-protein kinase At5g35370 n=1 Tax=Andrographis paniculata TaxID=175694 RepID=UPI0021E7BAD7|nr:G-type lectin S-receptor-like serine/threonine-protein kinase At5g35370 [Andrographis paniculata]
MELGKDKPGSRVLAVALPLSIGVGVAILAGAVLRARMKRRRWGKQVRDFEWGRHNSSSAGMHDFSFFPGLPEKLEYKDIMAATQGFSMKIGSGGYGTVYKGTLVDRTDVAVKRLDCSGAEAKREFLTEIAAISRIHHVNLVGLKGFCIHRGQRFLVYEYMNQGSLDRTLFHGEPVMEWKERFKIALGTARGLEYLHTCCEHKIIHCDVKPENILLHDNLQVKVSDFGLSKLLTREQSGFFTLMRGTRGYIAPEWLTNTAISEKTDVYSYGMVLLEIVSGKKNFFLQPDCDYDGNSPFSEYEHRQVNFPLCALEMHLERRYLELVDPRIMGRVTCEEVEKLVRVALCCVHQDPNLRPSMSDVVRMLEGLQALAEPRTESLNFLKFYDPAALVENNVEREVVLQRQETSYPKVPKNSFSHMSSQQVSGPR